MPTKIDPNKPQYAPGNLTFREGSTFTRRLQVPHGSSPGAELMKELEAAELELPVIVVGATAGGAVCAWRHHTFETDGCDVLVITQDLPEPGSTMHFYAIDKNDRSVGVTIDVELLN